MSVTLKKWCVTQTEALALAQKHKDKWTQLWVGIPEARPHSRPWQLVTVCEEPHTELMNSSQPSESIKCRHDQLGIQEKY